MHLLGEPEVEK